MLFKFTLQLSISIYEEQYKMDSDIHNVLLKFFISIWQMK